LTWRNPSPQKLRTLAFMKSTGTKPRPLRRKGSARIIAESTAAAVGDDNAIYERPDGWYWAAPDGHQDFGPFGSRELARVDRDRFDDQALEAAETVQEAEQEIGVAHWIDAETGEPAEGQSPPHFEEP
jgi:hypothetical protein